MKKIFVYLAGVVALSLLWLALFLAPVYSQGEGTNLTPTPNPTATALPEVGADPGPQESNDDLGQQTHIVQAGETLIAIAEMYSTTVEALQQLNGIVDPTTLQEGQELIVSSSEGELLVTTHTIGLGDSLQEIAAAYSNTVETLAELNHLLNPDYLPAGAPLAVLGTMGSPDPRPFNGLAHLVQPEDSLLTISVEYGLSPPVVAAANELGFPAYLYPGQRLRLPSEEPYRFIPGSWRTVALQPLPLIRGQTAGIYVETLISGVPSGEFAGQDLRFVPRGEGYVALVGIDAFTEPGRYPLTLRVDDEPWPSFEQQVVIEAGSYGTQYIQIPEELAYLLEPGVREEEDAFLATVYEQVSPNPLWDGPFLIPVADSPVTAAYGDARSYNGGPIEIYHTGVDFAGTVGTPIMAPGPGKVVFSDTLSIRGDTLILDHGLGVMTGYYHLSLITVQVGEQVAAGQPIAEGGSTGLSTGPHLHWDLRVVNVPVDGMQWTDEDPLSTRFLRWDR